MAKTLSLLLGAAFVLLGGSAFLPNTVISPSGIFLTSTILGSIYILSGLILFLVGLSSSRAVTLCMKVLGALYVLGAIAGLVLLPQGGHVFGTLWTNMPDHYLAGALGVALLVAGFSSRVPRPITITSI